VRRSDFVAGERLAFPPLYDFRDLFDGALPFPGISSFPFPCFFFGSIKSLLAPERYRVAICNRDLSPPPWPFFSNRRMQQMIRMIGVLPIKFSFCTMLLIPESDCPLLVHSFSRHHLLESLFVRLRPPLVRFFVRSNRKAFLSCPPPGTRWSRPSWLSMILLFPLRLLALFLSPRTALFTWDLSRPLFLEPAGFFPPFAPECFLLVAQVG